jgi:myxalamid-type polyketide synthase MxaC
VSGGAFSWGSYYEGQGDRKLVLPSYAWDRQRYWVEAQHKQADATGYKNDAIVHPLLGRRINLATDAVLFENRIDQDNLGYLAEHRVHGIAVLPASGFVELACAAGQEVLGQESGISLRAVSLREALRLPPEQGVTIQVVVIPQGNGASAWRFEIYSNQDGCAGDKRSWQLHAEGQLSLALAEEVGAVARLEELQSRCSEAVAVASVYERCEQIGISYGECFRVLRSVWTGEGECLAEVSLPDSLANEALAYVVHPVLLDGCFQGIAGLVSREAGPDETYLPVGIGRVVVHGRGGLGLYSHVRASAGGGGRSGKCFDVQVYNRDGQLLVSVEALELRAVPRQRFMSSGAAVDQWLYQVRWQPQLPWSGAGRLASK